MQISKKQKLSLLTLMLVASICSIIYEFAISTTLSYLVGRTITNFSLTIGWFMFSIGIGSYLTKFVTHNYIQNLLNTQIINSLLGGVSSSLIYFIHISSNFTYFFSALLLLLIGICIGFEIPMVVRIFESSHSKLKDSLADILTIDYIGALLASIAFPFVLLPLLGVQLTTIVLGIINLSVTAVVLYKFKDKIEYKKYLLKICIAFSLLLSLLIFNQPLNTIYKKALFGGEVILEKNTRYQNIAIAEYKDEFALFLDNKLQFNTRDEARYHESLVHIPISFIQEPKTVLVLGGGDGLVARELLKHSSLEKITIVDIDEEMTDLAKENPILKSINQNSFSSDKIIIKNLDAFVYPDRSSEKYDLIIADLVDPGDMTVGRLYTKEFYQKIKTSLNEGGVFVTQASSPLFAREAFWSINQSLEETFRETKPYNINVPSFGEWGFVIASDTSLETQDIKNLDHKFLNDEVIAKAFVFSSDTKSLPVNSSTLQDQNTVHYYWKNLQQL